MENLTTDQMARLILSMFLDGSITYTGGSITFWRRGQPENEIPGIQCNVRESLAAFALKRPDLFGGQG